MLEIRDLHYAWPGAGGDCLVVDSARLWTELGGDPSRGSTLFASVLIGGESG